MSVVKVRDFAHGRLSAAKGGRLISAEEGLWEQWGEKAPETFIARICP